MEIKNTTHLVLTILPFYKINEQQKCYLLYTNEKTHEIIRNNLEKSAMYGGYVTGIGPRYCPSIEDKLVRFADKERHQLFLEPESLYYDEWYLQGFSTSMPRDVPREYGSFPRRVRKRHYHKICLCH